MQNDTGTALAAPRKLMLAAAAVAIIAGPVGFGVLTPERVSAQATDTLGPPFARVSVTSHDPADDKAYPYEMDGDRFIVRNLRLRNLILNAYHLRPPQLTMDDWAIGGLGPMLGRLVQNETALAGHFDLDVTWPPDSRPPGPQAAGVGPAMLTAIEEQLGLKVEERTGNVEVFVIEDIQRRP